MPILDKDKALSLYNQGLTLSKIAKACGVSNHTIRRWLDSSNLHIKQAYANFKPSKSKLDDDLIYKLFRDGLSDANIAVQPNYWYVDKDGWVMHKKTLWNHSRKMKLTEAGYAEAYGFTKIWGKEKYKYTKELQNGK